MSFAKISRFTSLIAGVLGFIATSVDAADICSVEGLTAAKETLKVKERRKRVEEVYQLFSIRNSSSAGGNYGPSGIDYSKAYQELNESERAMFENYLLDDNSTRFNGMALQYLSAVCAEPRDTGLVMSVEDSYSTLNATVKMRFIASDVGAVWKVSWDKLTQYNLNCPSVINSELFKTAKGVTLNCKIGRVGKEDGKRQRYDFRLPTLQGDFSFGLLAPYKTSMSVNNADKENEEGQIEKPTRIEMPVTDLIKEK